MVADAISGALTSLNLSAQAVNSLLSLKVGVEVQSKAIELNSKIIEAQGHIMSIRGDYSAAIEQIEALKKEIMDLKSWKKQSESYHFKEVHPGAFTYAFKPQGESAEPVHWLCVNCFDNHRKSVLQKIPPDPKLGIKGRDMIKYYCHTCKSSIAVRYSVSPKDTWAKNIE